MAKWLSDQWKQIRGHVKYEILKVALLTMAGSGIIAASSAMLRKKFRDIDADWFAFGAIFCCSLLIFLISLSRLTRKSPSGESAILSNQLRIDSLSETVKLGALWVVPTTTHAYLSLELLEIPNENEVVIELTSGSIQYAGANVQWLERRPGLGVARYRMPRASVGYGDDCVSHWTMGESSFNGFYVYLSHANKFAQDATFGVFTIDAYQQTPKSAEGETDAKPD